MKSEETPSVRAVRSSSTAIGVERRFAARHHGCAIRVSLILAGSKKSGGVPSYIAHVAHFHDCGMGIDLLDKHPQLQFDACRIDRSGE